MSLDLKGTLFYTPAQMAEMFGKPVRGIYRAASGDGFLAPAARRFNSKTLLFLRSEVQLIIDRAASKKDMAPADVELYNYTTRRGRHDEE